jgi:hypothetical protein
MPTEAGASETDNKDALASGKNRSTLLPNIPPHTEIKVTAEGLGARPALLPAQQLRQLGEVRRHAVGLVALRYLLLTSQYGLERRHAQNTDIQHTAAV